MLMDIVKEIQKADSSEIARKYSEMAGRYTDETIGATQEAKATLFRKTVCTRKELSTDGDTGS